MRLSISRILILLSVLFIYERGVNALAQNTIGKSAFHDVYRSLDKYKGISASAGKSSISGEIINIQSQEDFLRITQLIKSKVNKGAKSITIVFKKGRYEYNNNHIYLTGNQFKNVSIRLLGNNSEIISAGKSFSWNPSSNDYFNKNYEYIDESGKDFDIWSEAYQADKLIEVVNEKERLCRVHCDDLGLTTNLECQNVEILLTMWYRSEVYKVKKIDKGYVYFVAGNLSRYKGNYNVNQDYLVGKVYPRFKLCNTYRTRPSGRLYECQKSRFLFLSNVSFVSFEISGFVFNGGTAENSLIQLKKVSSSSPIKIHNNTFQNMKGRVISISETHDVQVFENSFESNYTYCISSGNSSKNTCIVRNSFSNIGLGMDNTFCIVCRGENYYIANNEICDFGYGGIGIGVWYKDTESKSPSCGIVENNHLWYSEEYKKNRLDHSLIDSGAIYTWTKNNSAIVRYNFIHDYNGMGSNRGVYCDDGAKNVKIYGNIVMDIENGNTIDCRSSSSLTKVDKSDKTNNTGNVMIYNLIGGKYKFQGRKGSNQCYKGQNILMGSNQIPSVQNTITNISYEEQDCLMSDLRESNGKLEASGNSYSALKSLPFFDKIKDFIIVK